MIRIHQNTATNGFEIEPPTFSQLKSLPTEIEKYLKKDIFITTAAVAGGMAATLLLPEIAVGGLVGSVASALLMGTGGVLAGDLASYAFDIKDGTCESILQTYLDGKTPACDSATELFAIYAQQSVISASFSLGIGMCGGLLSRSAAKWVVSSNTALRAGGNVIQGMSRVLGLNSSFHFGNELYEEVITDTAGIIAQGAAGEKYGGIIGKIIEVIQASRGHSPIGISISAQESLDQAQAIIESFANPKNYTYDNIQEAKRLFVSALSGFKAANDKENSDLVERLFEQHFSLMGGAPEALTPEQLAEFNEATQVALPSEIWEKVVSDFTSYENNQELLDAACVYLRSAMTLSGSRFDLNSFPAMALVDFLSKNKLRSEHVVRIFQDAEDMLVWGFDHDNLSQTIINMMTQNPNDKDCWGDWVGDMHDLQVQLVRLFGGNRMIAQTVFPEVGDPHLLQALQARGNFVDAIKRYLKDKAIIEGASTQDQQQFISIIFQHHVKKIYVYAIGKSENTTEFWNSLGLLFEAFLSIGAKLDLITKVFFALQSFMRSRADPIVPCIKVITRMINSSHGYFHHEFIAKAVIDLFDGGDEFCLDDRFDDYWQIVDFLRKKNIKADQAKVLLANDQDAVRSTSYLSLILQMLNLGINCDQIVSLIQNGLIYKCEDQVGGLIYDPVIKLFKNAKKYDSKFSVTIPFLLRLMNKFESSEDVVSVISVINDEIQSLIDSSTAVNYLEIVNSHARQLD